MSSHVSKTAQNVVFILLETTLLITVFFMQVYSFIFETQHYN